MIAKKEWEFVEVARSCASFDPPSSVVLVDFFFKLKKVKRCDFNLKPIIFNIPE